MLYLLRVGADKTYGGFYSPIFENREYLFIPIPGDSVYKENGITYSEYQWNGRSALPYVPEKLRFHTVHNDPEFLTCTYGSPKRSKNGIEKNFRKLKGLQEDDLLVFYAGFEDVTNSGLTGYYFFAYFNVEQSIYYSDVRTLTDEQRALMGHNHHVIHKWNNQVVVVGNKEKSKVFEKAVCLCLGERDRRGSNYYPCEEITELLGGYDKSMNMSSLREFESPSIKNEFKAYLDEKSGKNLLRECEFE